MKFGILRASQISSERTGKIIGRAVASWWRLFGQGSKEIWGKLANPNEFPGANHRHASPFMHLRVKHLIDFFATSRKRPGIRENVSAYDSLGALSTCNE